MRTTTSKHALAPNPFSMQKGFFDALALAKWQGSRTHYELT